MKQPAPRFLAFLAVSIGIAAALSPPPAPGDSSFPPGLTRYERPELTGLFHIAEHPERIPWKPFRPGVEIHRLYGDGIAGPTAALLRFAPGATVAPHEHPGYEHILVLSGSQRDQNATATAGTLVVNPPGSRHQVESTTGCIVLAVYEKPVRFLNDHPAPP